MLKKELIKAFLKNEIFEHLIAYFFISGIALGTEVKFSSPDLGGFFIRHDEDPLHRPPAMEDGDGGSHHPGVAEVKSTQFTVLDTKQPVTVRKVIKKNYKNEYE